MRTTDVAGKYPGRVITPLVVQRKPFHNPLVGCCSVTCNTSTVTTTLNCKEKETTTEQEKQQPNEKPDMQK